jgi:hypothetical protein
MDLTEIDRKISVLKVDEDRLHALWEATADDDIAGQRALEVELNVIVDDMTELCREREEAWAAHASQSYRDTANRLNPSER